MDAVSRPHPPNLSSRLLYGIACAGPVLLLIAATYYGILEVHSSTDTWIGLAAARQIVEFGHVPLTDTFSFTHYGEPWYNQNWLSHLYLYWCYAAFGPDAVVYGTWAVSASIFQFTLVATWFRTRRLIPSLIAAACVGLGCRDFLSARPATMQFFCISVLWMLVCALEGQREKRRWWPIVALVPLMLVWGNAHGSFPFGFAVLAAYVAHFAFFRWLLPVAVPADLLDTRAWVAIDWRQALGVAAAIVITVVAILLISPFGVHNFWHSKEVVGSEIWRTVGEWHSPLSKNRVFPPVWRFWVLLIGSGALLLGTAVLVFFASPDDVFTDKKSRPKPRGPQHFWSVFDLGAIAVGLGMTFFARRFAPIFFIVAAPAIATFVMILVQRLSGPLRRGFGYAVLGLCWLAAGAVGLETWKKGHQELVANFDRTARPELAEYDLLDRVTQYQAMPDDAIEFLRANQLETNLFVEWTQGGPVMFYAPNCRLFMDGRAQQVYSIETYKLYSYILNAPATQDAGRLRALEGYGPTGNLRRRADGSAVPPCDGVMFRISGRSSTLATALETSPEWTVVFLQLQRSAVFLRRGSKPLLQLQERLRSGSAVWPDVPESDAMRGNVFLTMVPPDLNNGLARHLAAVAASPRMGLASYNAIFNILLATNQAEQARAFLASQRESLASPDAAVSETDRASLRGMLDRWQQEIDKRLRRGEAQRAP